MGQGPILVIRYPCLSDHAHDTPGEGLSGIRISQVPLIALRNCRMQTSAGVHAGRISRLADATVLAIFVVIAACFIVSLLRGSAGSKGVALTGTIAAFTVAYNPSTPSESIRDAAVYFSVGLLAIASIIRPDCIPRRMPVVLTSAWYAIFLGVTYSTVPGNVGLLFKFGVISALVVIVAARSGKYDREVVSKGVVLLAVFHVLIGMTEFLTNSPFIWGYDTLANGLPATYANPFAGGDLARIQSTLGHPIPLGVLIAVALALLLANWRMYRRSRTVLIGLVLGAGLFFNGSRSAVLALIAGVLYILLFSYSTRGRLQNVFIVLLASVSLVIFDFGIGSLVGDFVDSGSFTNRLEALESAPGLVSRPLDVAFWGSGFGTEPILFAQGLLQQNGFGIVDNQFVTTLATFGIFGLFLMLVILVRSFMGSDAVGRSVLIVLMAMMFSFDYLRWPETFVLLFAFVGLAGSASVRRHVVPPQNHLARRSRLGSEFPLPH